MENRYRRWMLGVLPILLGGLAVLHCGYRSKSPRNVLIITVDTLRADRLGCYGYDKPTTPNIDRLAEEGVRFEKTCCQAPLTLPSHCSIFTSRHTISHGSLGHAYPLNPAVTTLAEVMKQRGKATAAFISNRVLDKKYGLARGFDTYWQIHDLSPEERDALFRESKDPTTLAVLEWLRAHHGEPFFLWVHWFHPHKPYYPPADYALRFARTQSPRMWTAEELTQIWRGLLAISADDVETLRALYDGEVAFSDAQVGLLLEALKELGVYDRTLIVLTSDHGEVLYEHKRYFGHDIMLYEPSMRVPLVIRHPGWRPATVPGLVQLIDIMPTALAALGVSTEAPLEGKDLAPLARGTSSATVDCAVCLSYPPKEKSRPIFGLRTANHKLILNETEGGFDRELYDLTRDPEEKMNLAEAESDRADALEARYLRWAETVRSAADTSAPQLDVETLEHLRSLGYIQ